MVEVEVGSKEHEAAISLGWRDLGDPFKRHR